MNVEPSSAYTTSSPSFHPTVVNSPFCDGTAREPVFISMNAPVPYVHLASPTAKQACPNSAAC